MAIKRQSELFSDWLENYIDYERIKRKDEFSLDTMQYLVERFRHPERAFKTIHVAGSKGKGSISAMIARIFEAAGHTPGLYSSPHLLDFTERVATASGPFEDSLYGRAADIVVPLVESIIPANVPGNAEPTWFELVTLFAFVTFREAGLEWAVIETGLGGRLDATNVIIPRACVITPIELEHTEYLGSTISAIAGEKAGIIKEAVPVFLSEQSGEARSVLETTAKKRSAPCFSMDDALRSIEAVSTRAGLDVSFSFNRLESGPRFNRAVSTRIPMPNAIQGKNAALAAYVSKYLLPDLDEETIELGLSRSWLPGRFEILGKAPPIVLDGAHTVRSLTLTAQTFAEVFPGPAHAVFACAADKDVETMAEILIPLFDKITLTKPGSKKVSDLTRAVSGFSARSGLGHASVRVNENFNQAILTAVAEAKNAGVPLLITGSFYLVAEAKSLLSNPNRDRERSM